MFKEIHVFLLQYKWDWHAELRLTEVKAYLSKDSRVQFHLIDADAAHTNDQARLVARHDQICTELQVLYP